LSGAFPRLLGSRRIGELAVFAVNGAVMRTTKVSKRGRGSSTARNAEAAQAAVAGEALMRMRESNHRIKNHLQVLGTFLAMQSRQSADEATRHALLGACSRVAAVGRLHERLEQAELDERVEVAVFLQGLCADLRACFTAARLDLELDVETADLPAKTVLPLGLMVSELVTNAVKHASSQSGCHVRVKFCRHPRGWRLTVADNGPGIDAQALSAHGRVGGRLLFALARQLGGAIEVDETRAGASISVVFP
jgi:two-component sensor histidine kinase